MNKIRYVICAILVVCSFSLHAQVNYDSWLVTDRDVYASGETILSKIYLPEDQKFQVVYLRLTFPNGQPITNVKLGVNDHQATGGLFLPDSLSTGSYLLTAYSSHFEKQPFIDKEILVINRFENQEQEFQVERGNLIPMELEDSKDIMIGGLESSYNQREDVSFSLSFDNELTNDIEGDISLIISQQIPEWQSRYLPLDPDFDTSMLLTEKKGVVLQGKVTNTISGEPENGALVYLTIPDSIPYFDYYISDPDGNFFFLLENFYGTYPVFIQAVKDEMNDQLKVSLTENTVDQRLVYDTQQISVTEQQQQYFSDIISLVTFEKLYDQTEYKYKETLYEPRYEFPFYGMAEFQVDPDDYIELPDFGEISKEFLSPVRFRDKKDGYTLQIFDRDLDDFFDDTPLILIDGVPVQSISRIASMGSSEIDWIDVVPRMRFYGNQRYSGVLAIYTKEGDGSSIFASDRILKLDYDAMQDEISLVSSEIADDHSPDFRQVLLWNANIPVSGNISASFKTSDLIGTYRVLVSARKKNGEIIQSSHYFNVTK